MLAKGGISFNIELNYMKADRISSKLNLFWAFFKEISSHFYMWSKLQTKRRT